MDINCYSPSKLYTMLDKSAMTLIDVRLASFWKNGAQLSQVTCSQLLELKDRRLDHSLNPIEDIVFLQCDAART